MKTVLLSIMVILASSLHAQINEGLIAYYPFYGNANDESANDNHGEVTNAILAEGVHGDTDGAYLFNGVDTYITVPSSASLNSPDTALSMSVWVNLNGYSEIGESFSPILMRSDLPDNGFPYRLGIGTQTVFTAVNNWNNDVSLDTTLIFDSWQHLIVTYSPDTVKFYLNNVLIGEEAFATEIIPAELPLLIGKDTPGVEEIFEGRTDELRLYNRALTSDKVGELYEDGTTGLSEPQMEMVDVFPNPGNGLIRIPSQLYEVESCKVYNLSGERLGEFARPAAHIDITGYPKGVYFLVFESRKARHIAKVVKL